MGSVLSRSDFEGEVWPAMPTPFRKGDVDECSVRRCVKWHAELGAPGLFVGGTCGEGACLLDWEYEELVRIACEEAAGLGVKVAVQVTACALAQMQFRMAFATNFGASMVVIAMPPPRPHWDLDVQHRFFTDALESSPLPVMLYDRPGDGMFPAELVPNLMHHPSVFAVKDSTGDPERRKAYLKVRDSHPHLGLMTGDEFRLVEYIQAGYDGALLGGAAFNARLAKKIIAAVHKERLEEAQQLDELMRHIMTDVYGPNISWWLGGLKRLLVLLGVFSTPENRLGYLVGADCEISIAHVLADHRGDLGL